MADRKSLDAKIAAIHADPSGSREFLLADAKDADMAFGIGAPGRSPESHPGEARFRTLAEYRDQIRMIARSGLVDIMLMSASTSHQITIRERLFDGSHVTPAVRANDTTDVHIARGSSYAAEPARPFRSGDIDHFQCGHLDCEPSERSQGVDLGLYSVTFNNDLTLDKETLERFHEFRVEAERKRFRYFLEVFDPNVPDAVDPAIMPYYLNDMIVRMLAGVAGPGRPLFLKVVYHGPKALEELVRYDPHLIVGVLGGSAGTTRDAFQLLHDAKKHGARVALFGRKINGSENQLAFVHFLRLIADGEIGPVEAVRAYHAVLGRLGVAPQRPLDADLAVTEQAMSYGRRPDRARVVVPGFSEPPRPDFDTGDDRGPSAVDCGCGCKSAGKVGRSAATGSSGCNGRSVRPSATPSKFPIRPDGFPDFTRMDPSERLAYHRDRLGLDAESRPRYG